MNSHLEACGSIPAAQEICYFPLLSVFLLSLSSFVYVVMGRTGSLAEAEMEHSGYQ